jgi:hypothetical protein
MSELKGPPQQATFVIEGPDEDGCVWICSAEGRDAWCRNLGPREPVVAEMSNWLASAAAEGSSRP